MPKRYGIFFTTAIFLLAGDREEWALLLRQASTHRDRGSFAESLAKLHKAQVLAERLVREEPLLLPATYAHLGALYLEWRRPKDAETACRNGLARLDDRRRPALDAVEAHLQQTCGLILFHNGQERDAQDALLRAVALLRPQAASIPAKFANVLVVHGSLLHWLNRDGEAQASFDEVLSLAPRLREKDEYLLALAHEGRAVTLATRGRHAEAQPDFERALHVMERLFGRSHFRLAPCLTAFASTLRALKQVSRAKELETRARSLHQKEGKGWSEMSIDIHSLNPKNRRKK